MFKLHNPELVYGIGLLYPGLVQYVELIKAVAPQVDKVTVIQSIRLIFQSFKITDLTDTTDAETGSAGSKWRSAVIQTFSGCIASTVVSISTDTGLVRESDNRENGKN